MRGEAMYKLISPYGNEVAFAEGTRRRDYLLSLGFRLVEDEQKKETDKKPKNTAKDEQKKAK